MEGRDAAGLKAAGAGEPAADAGGAADRGAGALAGPATGAGRGVVARLRGALLRPSPRWLLATVILCLVANLALLPAPREDGHLAGSDGLFYFAIVRSLALDRDVDFANDYRLIGIDAPTTATGRKANPWAIGTPLLWLPFFGAAHGMALALHAAGVPVATDGTGALYEGAVCLGTVVYAGLGLALALLALRRAGIGDDTDRVAALLALWWASNVVYYVIVEPSMSHGLTIFANALFLWCWVPVGRERPLSGWLRLGFATALVVLTRWQDGIVAVLPLAELAWLAATRRERIIALAGKGAAFAFAVGIGFVPQLLMWQAVYGALLTIPQGSGFMQWFDPHIVAVLFSTRHGLLSWHPVYALALLGIVPLVRRDRALGIATVVLVTAAIYVNGATIDWGAGAAFGARRFVSLFPFLAAALAALFAALPEDGWVTRGRVAALVIVLAAWNVLSVLHYRVGGIDREGDLTARQMTVDRLLLPAAIVQRGSLFPARRDP